MRKGWDACRRAPERRILERTLCVARGLELPTGHRGAARARAAARRAPPAVLARSAAIARVTTRAVGSPSFSNRPAVSRQAAKKPPNVDAFAARRPGSAFHASRRSPTRCPTATAGYTSSNTTSGSPPSRAVAARRAGGRVRPSSRLSALARGPGAERGFRPRCTTARVAALAAFGGPGLARSRQRLVAASRALPFARRQSALGHPLPQAVAARASRDDGGSPNVPALRSGVSAPRSGWPSEWVRSASSQPTGRARLLSRSFGTEQRPAGAGGLWARSRGRPAWGLSPF